MKVFISLLVSIVLLSFATPIEARSGCCSHHGGVCGCGCCDGSPLSATCAPYYPQCNGGSVPVYKPPTATPTPYITRAPTPTNTPIPTPTNTPMLTATPQPTEAVMGMTTTQGDNTTAGFVGLGAFAAIGIGIARFILKKGTTVPRN